MRRLFGIFHEDIEIAIVFEHARVDQLILQRRTDVKKFAKLSSKADTRPLEPERRERR